MAINMQSEVDWDVYEALRRINCNIAHTYQVWVEVFNEEGQATSLFRYLRGRYQWAPSLRTFRTWMKLIDDMELDVRFERANKNAVQPAHRRSAISK